MIIVKTITLKKGLLFFWSSFYSWICFTNILDGFKALKILPESRHYVSGNYALVAEVTKIHNFPSMVAPVLFCGDILWQGFTAFLFWNAWFHFQNL